WTRRSFCSAPSASATSSAATGRAASTSLSISTRAGTSTTSASRTRSHGPGRGGTYTAGPRDTFRDYVERFIEQSTRAPIRLIYQLFQAVSCPRRPHPQPPLRKRRGGEEEVLRLPPSPFTEREGWGG